MIVLVLGWLWETDPKVHISPPPQPPPPAPPAQLEPPPPHRVGGWARVGQVPVVVGWEGGWVVGGCVGCVGGVGG